MAKIERKVNFGQLVEALHVLQSQPFLNQYEVYALLYNISQ